MLGIIKRAFAHLNEETLTVLYKSLIRPHLEYSNSACHPRYSMDIDKLESVQRRATKLLPSLANKPYHDRLKHLKLHSLLYRRKRGDMIQVYKFIHGIDYCQLEHFFTMKTTRETRGHSLRITKQCYLDSILEGNSLVSESLQSGTVFHNLWLHLQHQT